MRAPSQWRKGKRQRRRNNDGTNAHNRCSSHSIDVYSATTVSHSDKWHHHPPLTAGNKRPPNFTHFSCWRKWRLWMSRKRQSMVTLWYRVEQSLIFLHNDIHWQCLPSPLRTVSTFVKWKAVYITCASSSFVIDHVHINTVLAGTEYERIVWLEMGKC